MKTLIKILLIIIAALVVFFVCAYLLFQLSKARSFQLFGGLTDRVDTDQKVIALTFDDAPTTHSREVLQVLQDKQVRATFYVIGKNIEQYPQEAKAIVDAGMEIGNHSYSHQRFLLKSQSFIDAEVQKTNKLMRELGYQGDLTFRPPNGKKLLGLPWYLKRNNIQTIMWDVEPDTYYTDKEGIVRYTLEQTKPGSIILMHPFCDACSADREALPVIIDELKAKGYTFVTVNELLKHQK